MREPFQKPGQGNGRHAGPGGEEGGPGLEWFADSPFIQELAAKLTRSLRISRILGTLAGAALVLLVAALLCVTRMGWEMARSGPGGWVIPSGMTMPDGPLPNQMRPPCRGVPAAVLRGGCWTSYAKGEPTEPCNPDLYNPPPEATGRLKDMCFAPIQVVPPSRRSVGQ
jgi:hypothetical protein